MASLLERTEIGALVSEKREIISVPDTATAHDAPESIPSSLLPPCIPFPFTTLSLSSAHLPVPLPLLPLLLHSPSPPSHVTPLLLSPSPPLSPQLMNASGIVALPGVVSMADVAIHVGVVSMADVAMHLVREGARPAALKAGVVSLIGNSPEGLSLWVASTSTPLMQRAGGVRAVAVVAGSAEEEWMEEGEGSGSGAASAAGAAGAADMAGGGRGGGVGGGRGRERGEAGWVRGGRLLGTLSVSDLRGMDAETLAQLTSMKVRADPTSCVQSRCVYEGGGQLLGTLSVSDLRGMDAETLAHLTSMKLSQVRDFLAHMASLTLEGRRPSITCRMAAPLAEVMALAVTNRVHRVWVTGEDDELLGVVPLADCIDACRRAVAGQQGGRRGGTQGEMEPGLRKSPPALGWTEWTGWLGGGRVGILLVGGESTSAADQLAVGGEERVAAAAQHIDG
ncbi:unnamed protein product [Closterium sp. Naga37s-1]|nr:unnamed protein product [Closterium sp. Naga37s-1]